MLPVFNDDVYGTEFLAPCPSLSMVSLVFFALHRCRVFLQAKDGAWKPYKDKVYSLNGRKKKITLTALNVNIKPYV